MKTRDQCWKKLAGRMEEEVLDSKREAYRGRGSPLKWRRARRSRKYRTRMEKISGQESSLGLESNLQRRQSMFEVSTEEKEMRRPQRMEVLKDMVGKMDQKEG